jgi:asparagine synthase (glutamine-hydrolysing)
MCGICGVNSNDNPLIRKMMAQIAHRGPDQEGFIATDDMTLGHRRLSIIDLSEHGRQPMTNENKDIHLVFNGEIYNFQELQEELTGKGHHFASRTDSEVIIHAYEEYGIECLQKLRGMFAMAIWDSRKKQCLIARDRIGIKPLYYYCRNGRFLFASEIKAILEDTAVPRRLNRQALYDYIGFEFVPAPDTMFEDIHKMPSGHYGLYRDGSLKIAPYWQLTMGGAGEKLSYNDAVEKLRFELDFAVKSHLVSDVPLGVFLSGGLDSSALVAMMRRHISGPLRTFTIGYKDRTFSELDYAEIVAKKFETEHHILMIDDLNPEYVEKVLWHLDEPMTDLSTVPLYLVCKKAREHVTVCLSGEGGDESFAGYDRFKASRLNRLFSAAIPSPLRTMAARAVAALPDQPQKKGAINMLKRFFEGAALSKDGAHLRWQYFSNPSSDGALYSEEFRNSIVADPFRIVRQFAAECSQCDAVNRELFLDMRFMMTDSVLMKVDKMSMASSMEVRVPLLDHVFVEYIASLPGSWKLKGLSTKQIFRSALRGILPDEIVYRGKQGYSLPVKHLLRNQLRQYMTDLLQNSPLVQETMNMDHVRILMDQHIAGQHNHNHVLWALINVAIWGRRFLGK